MVAEVDACARMNSFAADLPNYTLVEIRGTTWFQARRILDQFAITEGLRAPDALQIAAALEEHGRIPLDLFITTNTGSRHGGPGERARSGTVNVTVPPVRPRKA